jgi:hypothetical protein
MNRPAEAADRALREQLLSLVDGGEQPVGAREAMERAAAGTSAERRSRSGLRARPSLRLPQAPAFPVHPARRWIPRVLMVALLLGAGAAVLAGRLDRGATGGPTSTMHASTSTSHSGVSLTAHVSSHAVTIDVTAASGISIRPYCGGPPIKVQYFDGAGRPVKAPEQPLPQICLTLTTHEFDSTFSAPTAPGTYRMVVTVDTNDRSLAPFDLMLLVGPGSVTGVSS